MKRIAKLFFGLLLSLTIVSCKTPDDPNKVIDYVSQLKLDTTNSLTQEVSIKMLIDGDTSHFYVPTSISEDGILKARYLGIDTPESTGKIEPWGKQASNYNKSKLKDAVSVVIESNDNKWNLDSTGGRYLVFVWYKTSADSEYKCLNLELLQEGLAIAKSISTCKYADIFFKANNQAINQKLKVYGDEKDPLYDYGSFKNVSLKQIRESIIIFSEGRANGTIAEDQTVINDSEGNELYRDYNGSKVRVVGTIVANEGNTYYIQQYDDETELYYGMPVFAGYNSYEPLTIGNEISLAGTVSYSEGYGYQISGVFYNAFMPNAEGAMKTISSNNPVEPYEILADDFNSKGKLAESTFVVVDNLLVTKSYTTNNGGNNDGAFSLTVKTPNGSQFTVRTSVLYELDENGKIKKDADGNNILIKGETYVGSTIKVKGIVEEYNGQYQVKVFALENLIIK